MEVHRCPPENPSMLTNSLRRATQCLVFEHAALLERIRVLTDIRGRDDRISPERFDGLWELFRSAARLIVTQHVVADAYGLRNRLASFRHQRDRSGEVR